MNNRIREEEEWTLDMTATDIEINHMLTNIRQLSDPAARRDLLKLHANVAAVREDISREAVRCRGFNRTTGTMQNLQKTLAESMSVLSQLLTMALLMG